MTIAAGGTLALESGTLTVKSGNFSIDANGAMTAKSGKIGGWNITSDRLYAGSGTSYVALNTNASYPAIWAGGETIDDSKFRVYQDGSVYISSLYTVENGKESKIDLRSNYWKMDAAYNNNITGVTASSDGSSVTLTFTKRSADPLTVNFSKADFSGLKVTGWGWPLEVAADYSSASVKVYLDAGGTQKTFSTSLNTSSFVNYGKTLMSVAIDPSSAVTLSPGGS